jgi:ubiquinone/menaquinone biosynthesis C-methylase UbiE
MKTKSKKELVKIWNQVPADYYQVGVSKNFLQWYWHRTKVQTFKKLIGKRKFSKILDVGAASGSMANEISKILPVSKITAIDVYPKAVEFGKRKYPHIKFLVADAHDLPFRSNSFDLALSYETIEHVTDPELMLREMKRVITRSGFVVLAMDSGNWLFRIVWFVWEKTKGKVWQGAHLNPYTHK